MEFNSLAPGRSGCDSKNGIFNFVLLIGIFRSSHNNALRWMPQDLTDDKSTLAQVMAWCHQATSHYLSQCWLSSLSPYGVTRPQWVNVRLTIYTQITTNVSSKSQKVMHKQHFIRIKRQYSIFWNWLRRKILKLYQPNSSAVHITNLLEHKYGINHTKMEMFVILQNIWSLAALEVVKTRTTRTPAFWDTLRRPVITHTSDSHQIPSQNKTKSKLQI